MLYYVKVGEMTRKVTWRKIRSWFSASACAIMLSWTVECRYDRDCRGKESPWTHRELHNWKLGKGCTSFKELGRLKRWNIVKIRCSRQCKLLPRSDWKSTSTIPGVDRDFTDAECLFFCDQHHCNTRGHSTGALRQVVCLQTSQRIICSICLGAIEQLRKISRWVRTASGSHCLDSFVSLSCPRPNWEQQCTKPWTKGMGKGCWFV